MKGQEVEDQLLSTHPPDMVSAGDGASQTLPAVSANRSELESTAAAQPPKIPPSEMRKRSDQTARSVSRHIHEMKKKKVGCSVSDCGGDLTDPEGSFSSPNHPGSYPPNLLCVWVIRVPSPSLVQIHVSSLAVEGPSPCLFDWLEVQEQVEQSSVVTRSVMSHFHTIFPFLIQRSQISCSYCLLCFTICNILQYMFHM